MASPFLRPANNPTSPRCNKPLPTVWTQHKPSTQPQQGRKQAQAAAARLARAAPIRMWYWI
nr:hypothetical protein [Atlantibacter sp.]